MSKMHHECGVVAAFSKKNAKINAAKKAIYFLSRLQHRGQDACGISYVEEGKIKTFKKTGLIKDNLCSLNVQSNLAIAHTRYATTGNVEIENAQPYFFEDAALCFNGTISDSEKYCEILSSNGFLFETSSDCEIILKWLFYKTKKTAADWKMPEIREILNRDFKNKAYSLLILLKDRIFAFKDPFSFRPLVFLETKNAFYLSSEASRDFSADEPLIKKIELKNGEGVEITAKGVIFSGECEEKNKKQCVFEVIYFANRNSDVFGVNVKDARIKLGEILAQGDEIEADCVIPVMNSGFWGAFGYARKKNLKLCFAIKNRENILRSFIEKEEKRKKTVEEKYFIKKSEVEGKNVAIVDDSIVRATTAKKIIKLLKAAGAKKIHIRLTSPAIVNSCFWGVDIPDKNELFMNKFHSGKKFDIIDIMQDAAAKELGADSLRFIPQALFEKEFREDIWCHNCFKN